VFPSSDGVKHSTQRNNFTNLRNRRRTIEDQVEPIILAVTGVSVTSKPLEVSIPPCPLKSSARDSVRTWRCFPICSSCSEISSSIHSTMTLYEGSHWRSPTSQSARILIRISYIPAMGFKSNSMSLIPHCRLAQANDSCDYPLRCIYCSSRLLEYWSYSLQSNREMATDQILPVFGSPTQPKYLQSWLLLNVQ